MNTSMKLIVILYVNKANLQSLFLVYFLLVYLSISTSFGWLCAHRQEKQLYLCDASYLFWNKCIGIKLHGQHNIKLTRTCIWDARFGSLAIQPCLLVKFALPSIKVFTLLKNLILSVFFLSKFISTSFSYFKHSFPFIFVCTQTYSCNPPDIFL